METFAFDPASNLLDEKNQQVQRPLHYDPKRNNLLREYAGSHYDYDKRGNQIRRWHNGQHSRLHWDLFDRLVRFENSQLSVDYAYDPLGRRLYKHSNAHHLNRSEAGSQWNRNEQARKQRELGCGFTLFGWDGDTLAWESSPAQANGASGKTVHYLYKPGTFVPVAQALHHQPMRLLAQPSYTGAYDIDQDPLWTHTPQALPIDVLAWYQCDHLGTPQELTDPTGQIAWSAQYKAWCGFTLFGWDGDTLAWESSPAQADGASGKTVHYLYEPGTFVPVAQALRHQPMRLLAQPSYTGAYDIDQDPLWTHTPQALPIDVLAWYQCDHLGTPQELTDPTGQIAWSAQYKAWGEVKEQRSEWARQKGLTNPIRFQGQYHDHETGLHYNRYRYYDPRGGRFVSKDPISYAGGLNLYAYAPNPVEWIDPLGLARCKCTSKDEKTRLAPELVFKTNKEAAKAAEILGFKKINEKIHGGQAVFKRGKDYITRDLDGHNGGAWKMAGSVKAFGSREQRAGAFDIKLKRIGD